MKPAPSPLSYETPRLRHLGTVRDVTLAATALKGQFFFPDATHRKRRA